jgi:FAD/FMN-containing dehydrogenase
MRIVNGLGEIVELGESDVRELRAARVGLGMLGVILEVDLHVEPRYHLGYDISYPLWQEVVDRWDKDLESNRHFSSMWSPAEESLDAYMVPRPEGLSMVDRAWTVRFNKVEIDETTSGWQALGNRNYRVLSGSNPDMKKFYELEYAVPLEQGKEAVRAVQQLMLEEHPEHTYPLFLRFVAGDDAYLSPFSNRASVTISVGSPEGSDYWPFFRDVHELLETYDARGHWGKLFLFDRFDIERIYPELPEFRKVREEFDPEEVFLNDSLRSLIV